MSFQISHLVTVHIIPHRCITHAIKFHICVRITVLEFLIGFFDTHGTQRINIFLHDFPIIFKRMLHIGRNRTQYTACCRNTDIRQFSPQIFLQLFLYLRNRLTDLADIMNLSIQHGSRLMLFGTLCKHMELSAV